jgi:hypothetical protein
MTKAKVSVAKLTQHDLAETLKFTYYVDPIEFRKYFLAMYNLDITDESDFNDLIKLNGKPVMTQKGKVLFNLASALHGIKLHGDDIKNNIELIKS